MDLLRDRLIECGWKDEMKDICRFGNGKLLTYIDLQIDNKMHGAPIVNLQPFTSCILLSICESNILYPSSFRKICKIQEVDTQMFIKE